MMSVGHVYRAERHCNNWQNRYVGEAVPGEDGPDGAAIIGLVAIVDMCCSLVDSWPFEDILKRKSDDAVADTGDSAPPHRLAATYPLGASYRRDIVAKLGCCSVVTGMPCCDAPGVKQILRYL